MKVDKMDGFCVGEPWNARAIADGIGYTAVTTQQMWKDHPEKVLAFTEEFAEKNPKTVKAILRAMTESSQYIDKLENRAHVAEVVSQAAVHQHAKRKSFSDACSATTTMATGARKKIPTT